MTRVKALLAVLALALAVLVPVALAPSAGSATVHSAAYLQSLADKICGNGKFEGATVWKCYVNPKTNRTEVTLDSLAKDATAVRDAKKFDPSAVTIITNANYRAVPVASRNMEQPYFPASGGSAFYNGGTVASGGGGWCSYGFNVRLPNGQNGELTAGHCFWSSDTANTNLPVGTTTNLTYTSGCPACTWSTTGIPSGQFYATGTPAGTTNCTVSVPCVDVSEIGPTRPNIQPPSFKAFVWVGNQTTTTLLPVHGAVTAPVGSQVVSDGVVSGTSSAINVGEGPECTTLETRYVCGVYVGHTADHSIAVRPGDSGGPIFQYDATGVLAAGITSFYWTYPSGGSPCTGGGTTAGCDIGYTSVPYALTKMGAGIVTYP